MHPAVEQIAELYRSADKGDALDRVVARHVVADVLNAADRAGFSMQQNPAPLPHESCRYRCGWRFTDVADVFAHEATCPNRPAS